MQLRLPGEESEEEGEETEEGKSKSSDFQESTTGSEAVEDDPLLLDLPPLLPLAPPSFGYPMVPTTQVPVSFNPGVTNTYAPFGQVVMAPANPQPGYVVMAP